MKSEVDGVDDSMEKDISAQYLNGFLLNEVGVSPKTQDHFIHILCVCERERKGLNHTVVYA